MNPIFAHSFQCEIPKYRNFLEQPLSIRITVYVDHMKFTNDSEWDFLERCQIPKTIEFYKLEQAYTFQWVTHIFSIESFGLYKLGGPKISEIKLKMSSDEKKMIELKEALNGRIEFQYIGAFFFMRKWIIYKKQKKVLQVLESNSYKQIKILSMKNNLKELEILHILHQNPHSNIRSLEQYFIDCNTIYIINPDSNEQQLSQMCDSKAKIPSILIKRILQQILEGIEFLHSLNIIHCDLNLENITINQQFEVKINDFGYSTINDNQITNKNIFDRNSSFIGNIPQENINIEGFHLTEKVDIYCIGVIFYQLLQKTTECNQEFDLSIFEKYDSNYYDLFMNMVEIDPNLRYSASDCLCHPFFIDEEHKVDQKVTKIRKFSKEIQKKFPNK